MKFSLKAIGWHAVAQSSRGGKNCENTSTLYLQAWCVTPSLSRPLGRSLVESESASALLARSRSFVPLPRMTVRFNSACRLALASFLLHAVSGATPVNITVWPNAFGGVQVRAGSGCSHDVLSAYRNVCLQITWPSVPGAVSYVASVSPFSHVYDWSTPYATIPDPVSWTLGASRVTCTV